MLNNSAMLSCTLISIGQASAAQQEPSNNAQGSNCHVRQQHDGAGWQHANDDAKGIGSQVQLALPVLLGKVNPNVGLHARSGHL